MGARRRYHIILYSHHKGRSRGYYTVLLYYTLYTNDRRVILTMLVLALNTNTSITISITNITIISQSHGRYRTDRERSIFIRWRLAHITGFLAQPPRAMDKRTSSFTNVAPLASCIFNHGTAPSLPIVVVFCVLLSTRRWSRSPMEQSRETSASLCRWSSSARRTEPT